MSQGAATSDLRRKRQRSPTPSRNTRQPQDIDELTPGVAEFLASVNRDHDDTDESASDNNDLDGNETEEEGSADDSDGDRTDAQDGERSDNAARHTP